MLNTNVENSQPINYLTEEYYRKELERKLKQRLGEDFEQKVAEKIVEILEETLKENDFVVYKEV